MRRPDLTTLLPPAKGDTPGAEAKPASPAALRVLRPKQWVKNVLVVVAPLVAGRLGDPSVVLAVVVAFLLFCAAASGCYLINDTFDAASDRQHPKKRFRPVAAGEIAERTAIIYGAALMIVSVTLAALWSPALALTIVAYVAVQIAYFGGLKHQPVLDLAAVSSGFLLRAVAGGTATETALSPWFLLVATFGAFFMVSGKRYSEMRQQGSGARTRPSLEQYSESYLRFIWTMAAAVTVTVYLLWALAGPQALTHGTPWAAFSVAPFVLGLLRYAARVDAGHAEAPEDVVLGDRHLLVLGLMWTAMVVLHATTH